MIDALSVWKSTFAALPRVTDSSWAAAFANWVDSHVTAKAELDQYTNPAQTFTFDKTTYQSELEALTPSTDADAAINAFADAWRTAIDSSVLNVVAGASGPGGTFTSVTSSVIDVPSRVAGRDHLLELITAPKVTDANDSEMPRIMREAFLLLTGTVTGTPFVAANVPFV